MARLHIAPLTCKTPTWSISLQHRRLVSEHSSLGSPKLHNLIYDDAIDVGIALYSPNTGHTITWHLHEEIMRGEDLAVWVFRPIWEDLNKHPQLKGWEVHILND